MIYLDNLLSSYHKKSIIALSICLLLLLPTLPSLPKVKAQQDLVLSSYTTTPPTIDGSIDYSTEWSRADTVDFALTFPSDSITGTLYMMNNDTYWFMAVEVVGDAYGSSDGFTVSFDNDNGDEKSHENGDDYLSYQWTGSAHEFGDGFINTTSPYFYADTVDGGELNGTAIGTEVSTNTVHYETCHPLDSDDNNHDFSLSVGNTVGFYLLIKVDNNFRDLDGGPIIYDPSTYASYIVAGPSTPPHLSAYSTVEPTLDGDIQSAEWLEADTAGFGPFAANGQTIRGTLYMMNNASHLFMAVQIKGDDDLTDEDDAIEFFFDNDNGKETTHEQGDDGLALRQSSSLPDPFDWYWDSSSLWSYDTGDTGENNVTGDLSRTASENHFEVTHPLDSTDDDHDFSLSEGDTVGFQLSLRIDTGNYYLGDWGLGVTDNPSTFANYTVASPPSYSLSALAVSAPTIDGSMGAGEWDDADSQEFVTRETGGGPFYTNGTIYVKNDATNLYILVVIEDDDAEEDSCNIFFDNDNGGGSSHTPGDDGLLCSTDDFDDLFFYSSINDFEFDTADSGNPGTNDGESDATRDVSNTWYFEFSHPLDSDDDDHDFSLGFGDTVGFCLLYWDFYSGGLESSSWPSSSYPYVPDEYGDIVITANPFVGMLNFHDYSNRMGSMPGVAPSSTLYFPHYDKGSSWSSYGAIVNQDSARAFATTTFYATDGAIIDSGTDSVDSRCKIGGYPPTGSGWIKVETN